MTFKKLLYLIWDLTRALFSQPVTWYVVLVLIAIVLIGGVIDSCRQRQTEKKLDRIEANITEKRIEANVLANQKNAAIIEVQKNETNRNAAEDLVDDSRNRDSNLFPTGENRRRYCKQFPLDSLCVEYCKTHNCY